MSRYRIFKLFAFVLLVVAAFAVQPVFAQGISFTVATSAQTPWDAVPSPDGTTFYFTAVGSDGVAGVFSVPASGGDPQTVFSGSPLVTPLGIAISTDGQTLYVTDAWSAGANGNAVFAVNIAAASVQAIEGTRGTEPQGIEVASLNGADQIFFTGMNPNDGQPALYTIAAGAPTILLQGAPLVAPSGVVAAQDGSIYILDRLASGNGLGSVLRIRDGVAETIAPNVRTGAQLAGLALTMDETTLLVSSLDSQAGTAQVLAIDLATLQTSIINDVIGENTSAGGLHRAHSDNVFAWVDSGGGGDQPKGRLYNVRPGG